MNKKTQFRLCERKNKILLKNNQMSIDVPNWMQKHNRMLQALNDS